MCGVAGGIWTADGTKLPGEVLRRMTSVIEHRGPDGVGQHVEQQPDGSGVALGHCRLSIIDLAGGAQPMANEDESVWVTFNGEIYNYRELREELKSAGHRFRTDSDTETLVHLYEEKGIDMLQDLRGMFAFAIWDRRRNRLLLARDRMGQKPLVYRTEEGRLLFASEIKSLLQVPGVPRALDPAALDEYLNYLYVPHPRTMFAGISKLPPAHYGVYENGQFRIAAYWSPDWNTKSLHSTAEMQEQLAAELAESIRLRLRSDVPLGAFLSGGIDSTVIVGLMQQEMAQPARTYTIGFPLDSFDESTAARSIAEHLQTDHHQIEVRPDCLEILPRLTWHYDEPFGDSSSIPTYYVAQATRQHVKVALTGDGGDELFGGYLRYQTVAKVGKIDTLPSMARRLLGNRLWDAMPVPDRQTSIIRRLRERMRLLREPPERRYVNWVAHFNAARRRGLYQDDFAERLQNEDATQFFVEAISKCSERCAGSQAMLADLQTYLPCDLLVKVDIASMAHGLECRSPFLDHRVVELAAAMPYAKKVSGRETKQILKQTFRNLIPPEIARRPKMGFSIPLEHWFRHELKDFVSGVLLDPVSLERGYFRPDAVRRLIAEHNDSRWDHSQRLWSLLCLELWQRTFIDPSTAPESPPVGGLAR